MERIVLILLTGLALGSSVVVVRVGLVEIQPLPLAVLRLTVASLAFIITLRLLRREMPRDPRTLFDIALVGMANTAFPLLAFTVALQFLSSGVLTIYLALIPLFTALMAHVWLEQERLTLLKIAGLVVSFGGVIFLLITRTTGLVASVAGQDIIAQILVLGGVLAVAAATVYTRLRLRGADALMVAALQTVVAWLAVSLFAVFFSTIDLGEITWRGWTAVVYTAIVGSFVGFFLLFYLIRRYGATASALPSYVMPAVSAFLGVLILGEIITLPLVVGAVLILAGVFLTSR